MELFAVPDLPEVRAGDDVAALIRERVDLRPDDVVCVASTIVSKAEGRSADLSDFPAGPRAREIADSLAEHTGEEKDPRFTQAVLEESVEILMDAPFLLTETRFGHVGVNAGIDRSNVPDGDLLLLPERPTESAKRIREGLPADRVVVTDTCGRPFRHGQRGVAIGWAGLSASRDWRGETDRDGRELGVTVENVVDELAAAANLVAGEGDDGTPAVVVRDFEWGDHGGSDAHFREIETDFVRQAVRGWSYAQ
ncbi:coenzyme F420-0:L-glutamate ligase [Halobellus inordinatus]|uniref:coenzyme F420-0:L-glutamate ligase n=1 Tax=Halobellus inordinatus TaxID=1126236 RepID=UPI0021145BE7|nr:coenzyme F420-0:L-glutamate ligase [Halobellus ramosii]